MSRMPPLRTLRFSADSRDNRYIPPKIGHMRSNITNSENTTLFLVSCFHYIFSGLVLNAGRPFRQPIKQNCETPGSPSGTRMVAC